MPVINVDKLYALAGNNTEKLAEELFAFSNILNKEFSIKLFFENDSLDKAARKKYFSELFPKASKIFQDFVNLMIDENMVHRIPATAFKIIKMAESAGKVRFAYLDSAFPLEEDLVERIKCAFGRNLVFAHSIDKDLIGGFRLRFLDGTILDASLAGKLKCLRGEMVQ